MLFSADSPGEPGAGLISGLIVKALEVGAASEDLSLSAVQTRDPLRTFRPGQWKISVSADDEALLVLFAPADAHFIEGEFELPSPREMQAIGFAADGAGAKKTAHALGISRATVPQHLASAKLKLSAHSTPEAVATAVAEAMIRPRRSGEGIVGVEVHFGSQDEPTSGEVVYLGGQINGINVGQTLDFRGVSLDGTVAFDGLSGSGRALLGPLGLEWSELEDGRHEEGLRDLFGPYERIFLASAARERLFFLLQHVPVA